MALFDTGTGTIRVTDDGGTVRIVLTNEDTRSIAFARLTVVEAYDLADMIRREAKSAEAALEELED